MAARIVFTALDGTEYGYLSAADADQSALAALAEQLTATAASGFDADGMVRLDRAALVRLRGAGAPAGTDPAWEGTLDSLFDVIGAPCAVQLLFDTDDVDTGGTVH